MRSSFRAVFCLVIREPFVRLSGGSGTPFFSEDNACVKGTAWS